MFHTRAVLTAKDWDKFGRRVNKGAKGIPQLVRINGYYNVSSIFDVSMTYGNKPYPIPEIKPEQMDKAIKELERLSPVNIIFQNEGVVGYDAEQHAIVFRTAMPQCEVLPRLPFPMLWLLVRSVSLPRILERYSYVPYSLPPR